MLQEIIKQTHLAHNSEKVKNLVKENELLLPIEHGKCLQ
jgi:hypothetical protein